MVNDINVNKKEKVDLFLAALNPYTTTNTVDNIEKKVNGKDFIVWGENNKYPNFLWELYNNCSTLQTIINGTTDYVCGNEIVCNVASFQSQVNKKGETISDLISKITMDYCTFGSFALQVIRNVNGNIAELYWVDVTKLRSDEKNEVFWYSDDWSKSYGRVKTVVYPKFGINDKNPTSIFYYKGNKTRTTYGTPIWNAATKNVQIDIAITDFHNSEINNNFMSSKLISFCNGTPSDEQKLEIENNLTEKFGGSANAARVMISFSDSKENAPEVISLGSDDLDKRYIELEKRNTNQIFVAFRAQPILFGLLKENNGFSQDEFLQAFSLYNRTMVKPIQNIIKNTFDKIFSVDNSVTITPFSIEVVENTLTNNDVVS